MTRRALVWDLIRIALCGMFVGWHLAGHRSFWSLFWVAVWCVLGFVTAAGTLRDLGDVLDPETDRKLRP